MKHLFTFLGLSLLSLSSSAAIIPNLTEMPFTALYSGVEINPDHVSLKTATLKENTRERDRALRWEFRSSTGRIEVSPEKYESIKALADFTLTAKPGDSRNSYGTAFHIGEGYILTNHHVLSTDRSNTTKCKNLSVRTGDQKDSFNCERVVYCHVDLDFCLIKLKALEPGRWSNKNPRQPETLPRPRFNPITNPDSMGVYAAIENPAGAGLHYSEGRGLRPLIEDHDQPAKIDTWLFFAPVHSGNSGGPLMNEAGEVVGVVYAQGMYGIDENGKNLAIPLYRILETLRENIAGSEELSIVESLMVQ